MSKKFWSGLITVFIIFIILQIIFNIRKQTLIGAQSDVPEIIVDMSTINASILAEELQEEEEKDAPEQIQQEVESNLPGNVEEIQKALKSAGFDVDKIDGKLGPKTKAAIRAFQKTHDLLVDGKVGRNTWKLLRKYLTY
ncbi:MAG: peptidoglycan-binding protein [Candidatus Omnitrophica bacterium]|nr:peptidoglycan-binding protein [Candidatus Omnitrophota bacterium]